MLRPPAFTTLSAEENKTMKHLTHTLLIAALAFGFFAMLTPGDAEAGWYHGRGCYRPSYSSYSYSCYRPTYSYTSYCAPAVYRTSWSTPSYSNCYAPSAYGSYWGGYGYGGNCGYGGFRPVTNYGSYGAIGSGYIVPVSYGYCGW